MKPEIFNEGKFVQCGKRFRGKIETIILTWPLRMRPFYLLTTLKYNKEFEYLKSNFNIWNFHFFPLKMSKQDISAFWELLSLPLSIENENFQPVLIIHVAPWDRQPSAERERWRTAPGPVTPSAAIPFPLPLPSVTYYWIGCGGRGGEAGKHFFVKRFVTALETHAIYIYGWVFGMALGRGSRQSFWDLQCFIKDNSQLFCAALSASRTENSRCKEFPLHGACNL